MGGIARLGFDFVHLGEFAWAELEPADGRFDLAWLDEAVSLADKAGLKVVLATPSLCPPAWMGEAHPWIYLVGADGRRREHGNRANASVTNDVYLRFVDRVVETLAARYGATRASSGGSSTTSRSRRRTTAPPRGWRSRRGSASATERSRS
ncbi:MAG: beta-galactosidase [Vicinamibacteria bacterium]